MTEKIIFNNDIIKFMSIFTSITNTDLKDCIESNNRLIFIVDENQVGMAIGKHGANVRRLEDKLKRKIKIVGYSTDPIQFIANIIHPIKARDIVNNDNTYVITPVDSFTRGLLIGRNAVNLREYEAIMKRYFEIKELRVI